MQTNLALIPLYQYRYVFYLLQSQMGIEKNLSFIQSLQLVILPIQYPLNSLIGGFTHRRIHRNLGRWYDLSFHLFYKYNKYTYNLIYIKIILRLFIKWFCLKEKRNSDFV